MAGRRLTEERDIEALVRSLRRIAVLGIKTEAEAGQPAIEVPRYLQSQGVEVVPVPVYFPEATHILGAPVFRRVRDVSGTLDCVDVFRRPKDLWPHLDDLKAAKPRAVWLQLGIRDDAFAQALVEAGIDVVQDRCLLVEKRRFLKTTSISAL
jgi:predicted CoA-binding protein